MQAMHRNGRRGLDLIQQGCLAAAGRRNNNRNPVLSVRPEPLQQPAANHPGRHTARRYQVQFPPSEGVGYVGVHAVVALASGMGALVE